MHHTDFRQLEREEDQNLTRNEYERGIFIVTTTKA